jgi:hypothetical protein
MTRILPQPVRRCQVPFSAVVQFAVAAMSASPFWLGKQAGGEDIAAAIRPNCATTLFSLDETFGLWHAAFVIGISMIRKPQHRFMPVPQSGIQTRQEIPALAGLRADNWEGRGP